MAAVVNGVTTADTGVTPNASGSFTPAVNEILVVAVVCSDSVSDSDDVPTASANGLTFTRATHGIYRTSLDSIDLYVSSQFVPSNPIAMTVTWGPTDGGTGTVINAQRVSGLKRVNSGVIKQTAKSDNQAAAGTPAVTFGASVQTDNPTVVAVGNSTNAAGVAEPSGWTERADTGYATPTTGLETASRDSGFTGTTITWGSTSASAFGAVAVELDASDPPGPTVAITKTATLTSTAATQDLVISGCLDGDLLVAVFGGDNGTGSTNVSAASAATQAGPGTTGAWTEPQENLGAANESWGCISSADVTGDGDITVRLARTQSTGQPWAGYVARVRNHGGVGNSLISTQSATETSNLTTSADSLVLGTVIDWDNLAEGNTIFTPNDALYIERNNATGVAWYQGYWLGQASGTRAYGLNGTSSSTHLRVMLVEVLTASAGDATPTPAVTTTTVTAPQATPSAAVSKTPAVTVTTVAAPQATPAVSDNGTPAAFGAVVTAPQATAAVADTTTPAVTPVVVGLPQATPTTAGNATATPSAIAAAVTLPQASPSGAGTASPAVTASIMALPQAARQAGSTVSPAAVVSVVALPQATPQAGGNATVAPSQIVTVATAPQALPAGAATANPARIITFMAAPTAIPTVHDMATPGVLTTIAGLPQSSVLNGAGAAPAAITALVTLLPSMESISVGQARITSVVAFPLSAAIDEGAQVKGTSTPEVNGAASFASVIARARSSAVTHRNSSTPTVSDG